MANNPQIEELRQAHAQGFISDSDFEVKLAALGGSRSETAADNQAVQAATGDDAKAFAKKVLKSDMAADMAAGAAGGAVIASVVPLVGTATGAVVGAALGAFKNFTRK